MKTLFFLLTIIVLNVGCSQKDCDCSPFDKKVEFYLLQSPKTMPGFNPTLTNPVIQNKPFIVFSEIEQYDSSTLEFTLKRAAIDRIETIDRPTPFAVTLNKQIIYTGYFWQPYLSSTCNGIQVDSKRILSGKNSNIIKMKLCNGSNQDLDTLELDKCNDERLLQTLAKTGKLK